MLEEAFGWVKEIGPLRHALARGLDRIGAHALLNFSAYQLTPDEIGQSAGTVIRGQHWALRLEEVVDEKACLCGARSAADLR